MCCRESSRTAASCTKGSYASWRRGSCNSRRKLSRTSHSSSRWTWTRTRSRWRRFNLITVLSVINYSSLWFHKCPDVCSLYVCVYVCMYMCMCSLYVCLVVFTVEAEEDATQEASPSERCWRLASGAPWPLCASKSSRSYTYPRYLLRLCLIY